jgi:hypothetical protein
MDRPTDGWIFGQAPSKLPTVPDIAGQFEAADIPKGDGDTLPHSLEWYAGAKDRQKARDEETAQREIDRENLRNEWAGLAMEGLEAWAIRVEDLANLQEPQDINGLLARTVAERPSDTVEIEKLKGIVSGAESQRAQLREASAAVIERLKELEAQITAKNQQDQAEEEVRKEKVRAHREHMAACEEALHKAQAMMQGDHAEDEEEEEGSEGEGQDSTTAEGNVGRPLRSGLAAELPPLANPPAPPPL